MPEEYGMDLAPNTASSIAVQLNRVSFFPGSLFHECFQIHRQPDPYKSRCVDSWDDTGIRVQEGTNYSMAVETDFSKKSFLFAFFMYWHFAVVPANVSPEGNYRGLRLLLAKSLSSLIWGIFNKLLYV